jgi:protein arginine kinase activator
MDCQCCNKNPARIRICDLEQNVIEDQYNVCPDCFNLIKRHMFDISKPLLATRDVIAEVQGLLSATGETSLATLPESGGITPVKSEPVPACPDCGMTLPEFRAKGRFGCPRDYEVFAEHLDPLLERIHDVQPARHEGRLPTGARADKVHRRLTLAELRKALDAAVAEENYELAAELRDRISEFETQAGGKTAPAKGEA